MDDAETPGEPQTLTAETRTALRRFQHDMRTRLGQVIGYGEYLVEELRERELADLVPDAGRIVAAGRSLLELVEDTLAGDVAASHFSPSEELAGTEVPAGSIEHAGSEVLVVDDEESSRALLSRHLRDAGLAPSEADSGKAALEFLESRSCDIVLLDFTMPELDGLGTLDAIRERFSASELPVLMATGRTGRQDVLAALRHGANDYVTKPLDVGVVLARIQTQLALGAAAREIEGLVRELEIRNAFLRRTFGRYLSDDVARSLLESDDGLDLAGERRRVTVLMADLRGFTNLTERIEPTEVVAILNEYLGTMSQVIGDHGGTVDEFIGDGVLALFGALVQCGDDAVRAVSCALSMQRSLRSVNELISGRSPSPLEMGIGIATGDVVVGNIGSEKRSKFTAIGSAVNLAARLEGYAGAGEVLISPATYRAVGALVDVDAVRKVEPKGFAGVIEARSITAVRDRHFGGRDPESGQEGELA
jgi:adenylate cyclase